jgi:hypothetical protein
MASCEKEKPFVEPGFVLKKWSRAIKDLNYQDYSACEAYPKSEAVFRDIYRDRYFEDFMVTEIEKPNEERTKKDIDGKTFVYRKISFECAEVLRKTKKPGAVLRGEVDFIKYIDKNSKSGWLMWNRNIVRIKR